MSVLEPVNLMKIGTKENQPTGTPHKQGTNSHKGEFPSL